MHDAQLSPTSPPPRIARARDAATLILLRGRGSRRVEVLIGRRGKGARFMPGRYVFPGGRVSAADRHRWGVELESADTDAHTLARAALRETFEETGLLIGRPVRNLGPVAAHARPIERAYTEAGLTPDFDRLIHVGRAITPSCSPLRFNARFFLADGSDAVGTLGGSGELDDLRWRDAEAEPPDPLPIATRYMLARAVDLWRGTAQPTAAPLLHFVNNDYRVVPDRSQNRSAR